MGARIRVAAAVLAVSASTLVGIGAAGAADTSTQFTLQSGSLAISPPVTADLGTAPPGSLVLIGELGPVTVSDTRGALTAEWTATVSSTDFTTGSASAQETVSKTNVAYVSGLPTASSGTGTFTPGAAASLLLPGVAGAWVGVGSSSVTWEPTVTVTLLPGQVAGVYQGVITHSVA